MIVIFLAIFSLFDPASNIRGGSPSPNFIFRQKLCPVVFFSDKNGNENKPKIPLENETGDREKKLPVCRKRKIPPQRLS